MYYDIKNQIIISQIPSTISLSNGTLITGPIDNAQILANAGYYPVRSDNPPQPQNTTEDVVQRVIVIDNNYVDITRTWIPIVMPTPETISARQIRLWLIDNNINLISVEAAINSIVDEKLREKTLVEWEYAPYIERNHPLLETLGSILGLTPEQIDQAFTQASML